MSVYTTVTEAEMRAFTARFDLGPLHTFRGVEAGVENTTYFVTLGKCEAVLQIFEEQTADEIPFFIELNRRLGADQVPVAVPFCRSSWRATPHPEIETCRIISSAARECHRNTHGVCVPANW